LTSGELYLIAGRRKSGKSVFMLNEAIHKSKMGLKVLMTSSELTDEKDTLRMLSIISGIPIEDIKLGKIGDHSYQKYKDAVHFIKHADFHREYDSSWSPEKVIMKAKTIKHKLGGLDYVVHDYIKDVKSMGSAEKSNALGAYCDALKNGLAGEMDIPCLSGVQLNRNNEIGDSDGLERYSTAAIKWERKTKEQVLEDGIECGNFKMGVLFARDGHTLNDEEDYLDYYMDLAGTSNLRIYDAKQQHSESLPQFMG
jgi:replicative DNA helicase